MFDFFLLYFVSFLLYLSVNFFLFTIKGIISFIYAIIGPNGVGKSTLFKILLGKVRQDKGEIKIGTNVHIGYYDQEQQELEESKTIFQEIFCAVLLIKYLSWEMYMTVPS